MRRLPVILAVLLGGATLLPVWLLPHFPGQDTPNHLYALHVASRVDAAPFVSHFRPTLSGTNVAFLGLGRLFAPLVGVEAAHRLFLSLYLLAFLLGALYLAGSLDRRRWPLGLLAVPLAFNWYVGTGLYNFVATIPIYCFAVGLMLRHPHLPLRALAALAGLGFLATLGHPLALLTLGASALAVLPTFRAWVRAGVALVPPLGLVLLGLGRAAGPSGFEWPRGFAGPVYSLATGYYRSLLPVSTSELPTAIAFSVLLLGACALALRPSRRAALPRPAFRLSLLLFGLLLLLPERSFDFDHISTRMAGFLWLSLLLWGDLEGLLARPRLLAGVALVLGVGSVGLFARSARAVERDLAEYTAGISHVRPRATLLPITFDGRGAPGRVTWPLLHAWGYYGLARDTLSPYVLYAAAHRPASLLAYRVTSQVPFPFDEEWADRIASGRFCGARARKTEGAFDCRPVEKEAWRQFVGAACRYDYVLAWAAPVELAAQLDRCFVPTFAAGRLGIYRHR